ncbi:TetR/AcrR family transcriptional regulator [Roseiterribacter gracilis]|uniref:TetR family transcriptional regulator n=1 Tax=Roseiterribacter gracilis TaxID=2812848 RepID=A0A8S8XL49_9PROT|nr:TetR family transcriptional regulator [Rhodospirillales bacterium TMPK1]
MTSIANAAPLGATRSTPRLRLRDRRRAIVEAAVPLFARKGLRGTTTRALAQAAGVSEALLYRHFPSKEALHQEVLDHVTESGDQAIDLIRSLPASTSTLVHMLTYMVHRFANQAHVDREAAQQRLFLASLIGDGEFARAVLKRAFEQYYPPMLAAMQAAEEAGDLTPGPVSPANRFWFVEHVASMLINLRLSGGPAVTYANNDAQDESDVIRQAVWFCCRGIGLTDAAIATHLNPQALGLLADSAARNAARA